MTLTVDAFITKWTASGGSERANYVSFLNDLCDIIGVPHPDATREDDALNNYVYERAVTFHHDAGTTSVGRIEHLCRQPLVCGARHWTGAERARVSLALAAPAAVPTESGAARTSCGGTGCRNGATSRAAQVLAGNVGGLP